MRAIIAATTIGVLALSGSAVAQTGQSWGQPKKPPQASPYQGSPSESGSGAYGQQSSPYGHQQPAPNRYGQGAGAVAQPGDYRASRQPQQQRTEQGNLAEDVDTALRSRGHDVGIVDGRLDAQSRAAIRAYQRSAGLAVTGEPSQALLADIESDRVRAGSPTPQNDTLGGAAGQVVDRFLQQNR